MVGLVGSGKSTFAKTIASTHRCKIHSSDSIRLELTGDINNQDKNEEVFSLLKRRVKADLINDDNVIVDCCNISYKRRMEFLKSFDTIKCEKECVLIATPYEDCISQDSMRDRTVGKDIIQRMYKNFYIPNKFEGFDSIKIMWNFNKQNFNVDDLFVKLNEFDQKTPYHSLTVGKHCEKAMDYIKEINFLDVKKSYVLQKVSLFHDIGKPFVKEWNDEKQKCTYYQHQFVSAYDAMFYLKQDENLLDSDILYICNLIQFHMLPYFISDETQKKKYIDLLGSIFYEDLQTIHQADAYAH